MSTTITIKRKGVAAVGKKEQRNALRSSMGHIGERHHALYKMLKFLDSAVSRYGLTPRSGEPGSRHKFKGSYTEAKLKRKVNGLGSRAIGETKPFVWSGGTRQSARASRKVINKAQSAARGSCDVIVVAPLLNLTPKGGRIKPREEFERIAEVERKSQEAEGLRFYREKLAKTRTKTSTHRG